jgi:hypothetical protein
VRCKPDFKWGARATRPPEGFRVGQGPDTISQTSSSLAQVQVYIEEVEQELAADNAMTKLASVPQEIKTATSSD